jgi:hypothetical protein
MANLIAVVKNGRCVIMATTGNQIRSFGTNVVDVQMSGNQVVVTESNGKSYLYDATTGNRLRML